MTTRLHVLPRHRGDYGNGNAQTIATLYAGSAAFGEMLVHEHADESPWSVVEAPTGRTLRSLTPSHVAGFARAMDESLAGTTDSEALQRSHASALVWVDGTHRRYRLTSARERAWFQAALLRTDEKQWFCRVYVGDGDNGGNLWLMKGGISGPKAMLAVGRHGAPWSAGLMAWILSEHASAAARRLDPTEAAAAVQASFESITATRTIDEEAVAQRFHLRRFPVSVRARGRADTWFKRTAGPGTPALEAAVQSWMERGEIFGCARPGQHTDDARSALVMVPLSTAARAFPRSVGGVPIRLLRMPRAVEHRGAGNDGLSAAG